MNSKRTIKKSVKFESDSHEFYYLGQEVSAPLAAALTIIGEDFPVRATTEITQVNVRFQIGGNGPTLKSQGGLVEISGQTVPQVLRALAALRGFTFEGQVPHCHEERSRFKTLGLMLDASRNAVPTVNTVKYILRRMALMGMNTAMLYTEDTYEVSSQPYFGYLRGRYTQAELRELDDYADKLGIEMIPCVQALGHLAQMLRWPVFAEVRDTSDILLAASPKTYLLLEEMLRAASAPYRSKRIHIGMDETHNLGLGRYLQLNGFRQRFDIINEHLKKVVNITDQLGLHPMIWSDMFFRLSSKSGGYYDKESEIPQHVAGEIPKSVQLVYWDYYHAEKEFYLDWIGRHRALGHEPVFASGVWTWQAFWANFNKAQVDNEAGMLACKESGVQEAFTTAWCDDGNESDIRSMLPGLQHFAEHGYADQVSEIQLSRQFKGTTGTALCNWTLPTGLDDLPTVESMRSYYRRNGFPITPSMEGISDMASRNWVAANPGKYLLWQDPLLGLFDEQIKDMALAGHYEKLSKQICALPDAEFLKMPLHLSEVLEHKAELGVNILKAYQRKDIPALQLIHDKTIPKTIRKLELLRKTHRKLWHQLYKPQGWEVLDVRYGGLIARLDTTGERLSEFLQKKIDIIPELEEKRLPIADWPKGTLGLSAMSYQHLKSPSLIN